MTVARAAVARHLLRDELVKAVGVIIVVVVVAAGSVRRGGRPVWANIAGRGHGRVDGGVVAAAPRRGGGRRAVAPHQGGQGSGDGIRVGTIQVGRGGGEEQRGLQKENGEATNPTEWEARTRWGRGGEGGKGKGSVVSVG